MDDWWIRDERYDDDDLDGWMNGRTYDRSD